MGFVTPQRAAEITGVHKGTLRRWANEGKIPYIRIGNGDRRYDVSAWEDAQTPSFGIICYSRVSTPKQAQDLERQRQYLLKLYPGSESVSDIGSGLNYKRKGFNAILERAIQGEKLRVVVTYRDRLVRFGFDLVERIIKRAGGEIVVLHQIDTSPESELVGDLTAIVTAFSARLHGLRSHKIKAYLTEADPEAEADVENVDEQC